MKPVVVKLGGSTAGSIALDGWVAAIAGATLPVVLVPGGGPFAHQVRDAQRRIGFSDATAHAMAILAMDQFGHVILDRDERLVPARSIEDMETAWAAGRTPLWLPSQLATAAADVPASWDVTSDSLAAWLAGKIGAGALLLIKQTCAFSEADTISDLAAREVVDRALAGMLPAGVDLCLAGPEHMAMAGALLSCGRLPGRRIGVAAEAVLAEAG